MAKDDAPSENVEQPEEGASPRKKKTLLLIIIAVVALVVVAGVGVAVYVLTNKPDAEQQADEHAEEAPAEEDEHPPIYEKLDSFTVNLADQESYLRVEVTLKVADPLVQEKIKTRMPEVRDKVLSLLSSKTPEELVAPEGKDTLAGEIQGKVNGVLKVKNPDEGVQGVLFSDFIIQ